MMSPLDMLYSLIGIKELDILFYCTCRNKQTHITANHSRDKVFKNIVKNTSKGKFIMLQVIISPIRIFMTTFVVATVDQVDNGTQKS